MTPIESHLRDLDLEMLRALKAGYERVGSLDSMEIARQIQHEIVRRARAQFRAARKQQVAA
jgi:hypothetical protein